MIHLTVDELTDRAEARLDHYDAPDTISVSVSEARVVTFHHDLVDVQILAVPEFADPEQLTYALDGAILHLAEALRNVHQCPFGAVQ